MGEDDWFKFKLVDTDWTELEIEKFFNAYDWLGDEESNA